MQFLPALIIATVAATFMSGALQRSDPVMVRAVIDGDTIDVTAYGRVRLLGIDAPEIARGFDTSAPFGHEARARLAALVLNRWIRLEREPPLVDGYNRHLAYVVREDGMFVNAVLVREGLARVVARMPLVRLAELKRAEQEAQAFRRGMWGQTPGIPSESSVWKRRRVASGSSGRYTSKSKKPLTSKRKKRRP